MAKKIINQIEQYRDYAVELMRGLAAIPAISPASGGEGEYDKAQYLLGELKKLKFDDMQVINVPDTKAKNGVRPNIIARYKGQNSSKTFWIMSHLDVVPPGDLSLWKTNPYELKVEDGKLYSRGAEDNHQGLVSGILSVKAMMDLGIRPPNDIALLFVADEETGSALGIEYLLENHINLVGKDDVFIVPDAGVEDGSMIELAEKTILWLKFAVKGKECHGSEPQKGINAFTAMSALVINLQKLAKKFNKKDKLFDPPKSTFTPTKIEANVPNINTVPGTNVFYMDCRVLPDCSTQEVMAEVKRLCAETAEKYGAEILAEIHREQKAPAPTSADIPAVKSLAKAIRKVYKVKGKPMGIGGGTVASHLRAKNFSAIVYSKIADVCHAPNEYAVLDNLIGDGKIFALTALNIEEK